MSVKLGALLIWHAWIRQQLLKSAIIEVEQKCTSFAVTKEDNAMKTYQTTKFLNLLRLDEIFTNLYSVGLKQ